MPAPLPEFALEALADEELAALEAACVRVLRAKVRPNLRAAEWALEHAGGLIADLSGRQERRVRNLVSTALGEGWSTRELADALEDAGLDPDRVDTIADHELRSAVNGARLERWLDQEDDNPDARKVWDAEGERCPVCDHLDGQTQFLDEPFDSDLGPVMTAPAHPHCDCTVHLVKG